MIEETASLRRCIGSARFGIEAHEAPVEDFPVQPSQKDGLGRMCKVHWNQYTAGLARDANARTALAESDSSVPPVEVAQADSETAELEPARKRSGRAPAVAPVEDSQGDAG